MSKALDINGIKYRLRRGKLVEIPSQWANNITTAETIRQRQSKLPKKLRRLNNGSFVKTQRYYDETGIDRRSQRSRHHLLTTRSYDKYR